MSQRVEDIAREWADRKAALTEETAVELPPFLDRILQAGASTPGLGDRLKLQAVARDVGNTIYKYTLDYPAAIIFPSDAPEEPAADPADRPIARRRSPALVAGLAILLIAFAVAAAFLWTEQTQTARTAEQLRAGLDGHAKRIEQQDVDLRDRTNLVERQKTDLSLLTVRIEQQKSDLTERDKRLEQQTKELTELRTVRDNLAATEGANKQLKTAAEQAEKDMKAAKEAAAKSEAEWRRAVTRLDAVRGENQLVYDQVARVLTDAQWLALEKAAADHCRRAIRACQVSPGGAFRVKVETVVTIQQAMGARAALALLVGCEREADGPERAEDLKRVLNWLIWYRSAQNEDGTVYEYSAPKVTDPLRPTTARSPIATAGFLLVLDRYHKVVGLPPENRQELVAAGKIATTAILKRVDGDGLTWDDLTLPEADQSKRFLTTLEDSAGLIAAGHFLRDVGEPELAQRATEAGAKAKAALGTFWQEKEGAFAVRLHHKKFAPLSPKDLYPDVRVNLNGFTWISPGRVEERNLLLTNSKPDTGFGAKAPIEWWCLAAKEKFDAGPPGPWRKRLILEMLTLRATEDYVERPAETLLTLRAGPAWLFPDP